MMSRIWYILVWVLHRHYPPRQFVFYPLYRFFRRRLRIPMPVSNLAVWLTSATLHGLAAGLISPPAGLVFFVVFAFLGCLSTLVILIAKPRARRSVARRLRVR
jgi:4-hydroxybenzoate polyprenyltransferase